MTLSIYVFPATNNNCYQVKAAYKAIITELQPQVDRYVEEVPDSDDEDEVHFDKNVEEPVGEQQEDTGTEVGDRSQGTKIYYTNTKLKALYIYSNKQKQRHKHLLIIFYLNRRISRHDWRTSRELIS